MLQQMNSLERKLNKDFNNKEFYMEAKTILKNIYLTQNERGGKI